MNRHGIWQQGHEADENELNPYDPNEPPLFMATLQSEKRAHTVTCVSHVARLDDPDSGVGEPRYGEEHWHIDCHNSGCDWRPEGDALGYENCDRPGFGQSEAERLTLEHMQETA